MLSQSQYIIEITITAVTINTTNIVIQNQAGTACVIQDQADLTTCVIQDQADLTA